MLGPARQAPKRPGLEAATHSVRLGEANGPRLTPAQTRVREPRIEPNIDPLGCGRRLDCGSCPRTREEGGRGKVRIEAEGGKCKVS